MRYLTTKELIAINTFVIKKYTPAEPIGVKDHALLESAVLRPQTTVDGKDAYEHVFEISAGLLESVALKHVFINGNKRPALQSLAIFLSYNGYRFNLGRDKIVDLTVRVVLLHYSFSEITNIIQAHS